MAFCFLDRNKWHFVFWIEQQQQQTTALNCQLLKLEDCTCQLLRDPDQEGGF
jgi:hypothetical protein